MTDRVSRRKAMRFMLEYGNASIRNDSTGYYIDWDWMFRYLPESARKEYAKERYHQEMLAAEKSDR